MTTPFTGEIRVFAGNFAPRDWHFCDGSTLEINDYYQLYSLLGTAYGGDGVVTFALPDLRGRIPIGQGQGPGLSNRALAEMAGTETVTLTEQQVAAHSHGVVVTADPAAASQPGGQLPAAPSNDGLFYLPPNVGNQVDAKMAPDSIMPAGGGRAHENRMPITAMNFIIALTGIYPSRN
jgi:microcystin-dependent protein